VFKSKLSEELVMAIQAVSRGEIYFTLNKAPAKVVLTLANNV
jgi:hypothetical protein